MRLDKYLKVSRLIKRRTVAKEVCEAGRIMLNGRVAKAGSEVKVGDHLSYQYGGKMTEVEVLLLAESMRAEEADQMYRVLKQQRLTSANEAD